MTIKLAGSQEIERLYRANRNVLRSLPDPRGSALPTCPVCADAIVAAQASAYVAADNVISCLWTCDTCSYGFVTKHTPRRLACN
jgi:hypothetical protein